MNIITKRIMALMLSLVMMLGCIPSFVNEVSAEPEEITIANVLATVEEGFPTTLANAWMNESGDKAIFNNSYLEFYRSGYEDSSIQFEGTQTLTDYSIPYVMQTISFSMKDNKLETITVTGKGFCTGTYKPVPKPISNIKLTSTGILATNVQSLKFEVADDAPYTLEDDVKWYKEAECATTVNTYTTTDPVYKKLTLVANSGYVFEVSSFDIPVNDWSKELVSNGVKDDGNKYEFILKKTVSPEHTKSASITFPITAGTTLEQIKNNISITTTATEGLATFVENKLKVFEFGNSEKTPITEPLVLDKEYVVEFDIKDIESVAYNEIKVNNQSLENLGLQITPVDQINVFYKNLGSTLCVICKFKATQPVPASSGSKKYKADDKDTAEKITGTGKKGSTRTITPIEGKKVASVVVTDKDGNKIDVTVNEDGTYSFKQPASDVNIEVTYKNREITLNIGSTEASVDGERENLDVSPVIRNDRTMLPIRFVAENLGAKVGWDEKNPNLVTISRGDTEIVIHLGSEKMLVNGKEVILDSVAFAENDRTYLPVRAISEALNAIVEWNEERPMEVKIYER